ncbi:MAG: sulfatase-like hydrolase/transferase [Myxococcota bacterium]|nr:sulfatase-like hydrolase/transferase [Myxococcota bacterium]
MARAPIVLLFLDQLRADAFGAAGNAYVRTPHIDALAAESVRFETCITNAPLCRPARICLLTGQPVSVHRFDDNQRVPRPGSLPSHVAELRDAGYHTAVVGKTHLHAGIGHLDQHQSSLEAWGYRDIVELPDAQLHQLRSAHSDWLTATTRPGDTDKHVRWKDFVANHRPSADPPDAAPWHLATEDHLDSFCARRAVEIVRAPRCDRPLYLQVCFPGPHPPFDPTSEYLLDPQHDVPAPISGPRSGPVAPMELRYRRAQRRWTADDIARSRRAYFGKVALVDAGIGRVLAALAETRLDERAWIILTADHGELLGDHGFHGKVLPFESSIRIPLLIRPPGGTTARVDRGVTELLDVVATVRGVAGIEAGGWGSSLVDRVRASSPPSPRSVVFQNLGYVGLRTPELTMTWDARTGDPLELFDRTVDPHQFENRVDDPGYKDSMRAGWDAVVRERARSRT